MSILKKIRIVLALLFVIMLIYPELAGAQCAMCTTAAENAATDGNTQGLGLNSGILFLLSMPYVAAMIIGILWYRNSRFRKIKKLNLEQD